MSRFVLFLCAFGIAFLVPSNSYSEGIRRAIIQKVPEDLARLCADAYVAMAESNPKLHQKAFGVPLNAPEPLISRDVREANEQSVFADHMNHRMWMHGSDHDFQRVLTRMDTHFEEGQFLALTDALLRLELQDSLALISLLDKSEWKSLAEFKDVVKGAVNRHAMSTAAGKELIRDIDEEIASPSHFQWLDIKKYEGKKSFTLYQVRFKGKLPYNDIAEPRTEAYDVIPMKSKFLLEQYGVSRYQFAESTLPWGRRGMDYWKDAQREKNTVHFDEAGLMRDSQGKLVDAVGTNVIMDAKGNWIIDPNPGAFHSANHSVIAGGRPVAFAGKMTIQEGRIVMLTRDSGHYMPSIHYLLQAIESLERAKAFQRGRDDAIVSWGIEDPTLAQALRE